MYKTIYPQAAYDMIKQGTVSIVDIRDTNSFLKSHLEQATHVTGENVAEFISGMDQQKALLVYCYHGNASQSAAAFFVENGFVDTYHLADGFEGWRKSGLPVYSE